MNFSHDQAKAIVEIQEEGVQRGFERLVEVLEHKLTELESRLRAEVQLLRTEIQTSRADLLKELERPDAEVRSPGLFDRHSHRRGDQVAVNGAAAY